MNFITIVSYHKLSRTGFQFSFEIAYFARIEYHILEFCDQVIYLCKDFTITISIYFPEINRLHSFCLFLEKTFDRFFF